MIKRLSKCIREYKLPSILAPIFISLEVILEVFIPLIMGELMDNGIGKGDTGYVVKAGLLLVVLCFLSLAGSRTKAYQKRKKNRHKNPKPHKKSLLTHILSVFSYI